MRILTSNQSGLVCCQWRMSGQLLEQLSRLSDSAGPQRGRNGRETNLAQADTLYSGLVGDITLSTEEEVDTIIGDIIDDKISVDRVGQPGAETGDNCLLFVVDFCSSVDWTLLA